MAGAGETRWEPSFVKEAEMSNPPSSQDHIFTLFQPNIFHPHMQSDFLQTPNAGRDHVHLDLIFHDDLRTLRHVNLLWLRPLTHHGYRTQQDGFPLD